MIDDRTETGKSFYETIAKEFKDWRPSRKPAKSDHIVELREHLRHPELAQVEKEYQRLKQRDRYSRPPNWYKLFGGPRNIYKLAETVGMLSYYKLYYQTWSASVHGSDASRLLFEEADGSAEFRSLRFLDETENKGPLTVVFLQVASHLMCKKFLRECDLEQINKDLLSKYGESLGSGRKCKEFRNSVSGMRLDKKWSTDESIAPACTAGKPAVAPGKGYQIQGRYSTGKIEVSRLFPALFLDLFVFRVDNVLFGFG